MQKKIFTSVGILGLSLILLLLGLQNLSATEERSFDTNRARLLGHMLQQQLNRHHYSDKKLDDQLSSSAYELYLKQLDGQKRFLLQSDIKALDKYKKLIDDAVRSGRLELPERGRKLLNRRIDQVRQ